VLVAAEISLKQQGRRWNWPNNFVAQPNTCGELCNLGPRQRGSCCAEDVFSLDSKFSAQRYASRLSYKARLGSTSLGTTAIGRFSSLTHDMQVFAD